MNRQESSYRWMVFCTVLLAYCTIFSQRTAPGLITDLLMKKFHIAASTVGFMSSVQFLAYAALQIPVGLLADRFGPNRLLVIGTLLAGTGTVLYGLSPHEYVSIFARFIVGAGDAMIFVNFILILSLWFKRQQFLFLLGIISMFAGLSSIAASTPLYAWISMVGWRFSFVSIGMFLMGLSYFLYTVLIVKPTQKFGSLHDEPLHVDQFPERIGTKLKRLVTTRQAWAVFLCHFGVVGTYIGFVGSWAVPYSIQIFHLSRAEASQTVLYGLLGAMIAGPLISALTNKIGSTKKVYFSVHVVVVVSWLSFFVFRSHPPSILMVVLLFLIGFGTGASSLTFSMIRNSFAMKDVGVVTGFANTGGFLSAVLLPSLFGHMLDVWSAHSLNVAYHYGFIIPVLFSIVGLVGITFAKEKGV